MPAPSILAEREHDYMITLGIDARFMAIGLDSTLY